MKIYTILFLSAFIFLVSESAFSQVTNLIVNGASSNFSMTTGGNISWSYNVPNGTTTLVEIWYDVNGSGTVDAGDVLYQSFNQTDGDTLGQNGPPDMDGIVNGAVTFQMPIGIAPGKYVLRFANAGQSVSIAGTVAPLSSPAYTISGKVTPPIGKSAANIFVELKRSDKYQLNFWDGLTDNSGNYTISMNSDTAGNPWKVKLVTNPFLPYIFSPGEQYVTVSGNLSNINFSFTAAAAQIAGTVKDENGNPFVNSDVSVYPYNSSYQMRRDAKTNSKGVYQIGLTTADLSQTTNGWDVFSYNESSSGVTSNNLDGLAFIQTISPGDSVVRNIVVYNANSTISGTVTLNGMTPGFPIQLAAVNRDSAQSTVYSDASTGNFSFPVSNKIYLYQIFSINSGQMYYQNNISAHPGATNVIITLSTTPLEVKQISSKVPEYFRLEQNYPNPFNPTTTIQYALPKSGHVILKVYDELGREVSTLVDKNQGAGVYSATFNGSAFASGVYFYKLSTGSFNEVKKLILLK